MLVQDLIQELKKEKDYSLLKIKFKNVKTPINFVSKSFNDKLRFYNFSQNEKYLDINTINHIEWFDWDQTIEVEGFEGYEIKFFILKIS